MGERLWHIWDYTKSLLSFLAILPVLAMILILALLLLPFRQEDSSHD